MHLLVLVCCHPSTTISANWHPLVQLERGTYSGNFWHDINTLSMYIIVNKSKGYIDAIEFCAQASMSHAIDEVKAHSEYKTSGKVS